MKTYPRVPTKQTLLSAFALALLASVASAADWPNWRGPNGDGTTSAKNLPESWSPDKNVKWKVEMPAWSGSSPMVWGDRVFVNTPSKEEVKPAEPAPAPDAAGTPGKKKRPAPGQSRGLGMNGPGGQEILLLCLDRATGKELWRQKYDQGNEIKMKQNMSSPTPVTDGKHVWVTSGNGVVACYDFAGKQKWTYDMPKNHGPIGIQFGYGSSPLLLDGKLIFQMLQGTVKRDIEHKPSFIFALDAATGKQLWKMERPTDAQHETPDSYTTPTVVTVEGKKQVVISGGGYVTGHDPETGAELWRGGGLNPNDARNYRVISSPLVKGDMVYAPTRQTPLIAFKVGAKGDITDKAVWKWTSKGGPDVPTPVSDGERFYMVDDGGDIIALNAKTGEVVYGPERTQIGRVSSSPIIADGKIYFVSETGETAVVEAGPKYRLISTNKLDGTYTLSTPAFVDGEIILRTGTHLYCIAKL